MQINYADEVIDLLTLLDVSQVILERDDWEVAEWLCEEHEFIAAFMLGKYHTMDMVTGDIHFLEEAKNIKNKLLESKE